MSHPGGAECVQVSWLVDIINGHNYDPPAEAAIATQDDIDITINNKHNSNDNTNTTNPNIPTGMLSQGTDYSQASSFGSSQLLDNSQQQTQPQPQEQPQEKVYDHLLLSSTAVAKGGVKRSRPIFGLQHPLNEREEERTNKVAVSTPAEGNNNDTEASIRSEKLKASQPPRNELKRNKSSNKENLTTTTITSPTPTSSSSSSSSSTNTNTLRPTASRSSSSSSSSILKHSFPTLTPTTARTVASPRAGMRKTKTELGSATSNSNSAIKKAKI